jgi:hypothetical protein
VNTNGVISSIMQMMDFSYVHAFLNNSFLPPFLSRDYFLARKGASPTQSQNKRLLSAQLHLLTSKEQISFIIHSFYSFTFFFIRVPIQTSQKERQRESSSRGLDCRFSRLPGTHSIANRSRTGFPSRTRRVG